MIVPTLLPTFSLLEKNCKIILNSLIIVKYVKDSDGYLQSYCLNPFMSIVHKTTILPILLKKKTYF